MQAVGNMLNTRPARATKQDLTSNKQNRVGEMAQGLGTQLIRRGPGFSSHNHMAAHSSLFQAHTSYSKGLRPCPGHHGHHARGGAQPFTARRMTIDKIKTSLKVLQDRKENTAVFHGTQRQFLGLLGKVEHPVKDNPS